MGRDSVVPSVPERETMPPIAAEIDASADFDAHAAPAQAAILQGDWPAALDRWRALREIFPDRVEPCLGAATAWREMGRYPQADECLAWAIARFPDEWAPAHDFAVVATYARDWEASLFRWKLVRTRFPALLEGFRGYAGALRDAGFHTEADIVHRHAMRRFPEDFWLAAGHALTAQSRSQWDEALRRWTVVRDRFPDEPAGHDGVAAAMRALAPAPVVADDPPPIPGVAVSHDPLIIHSMTSSFEDVIAPTMARLPPGSRAHYLFHAPTHLAVSPALREKFAREAASLRERFPEAIIVFLAADIAERDVARAIGLETEVLDEGCFVDERVFALDPAQPRPLAAIYRAPAAPLSRHSLAANVEDLALLLPPTSEYDVGRLASLLPQAQLRVLGADDPAAAIALRSARCGLCLSPADGAGSTAVEYLLCGLPVVTTRSIGGRDAWLADHYAIYAEDSAADVAACVARMQRRHLAPSFLRETVLQRMHRERAIFFEIVERIFAAHGQHARRYAPEFARDFQGQAHHRLRPAAALLPPG